MNRDGGSVVYSPTESLMRLRTSDIQCAGDLAHILVRSDLDIPSYKTPDDASLVVSMGIGRKSKGGNRCH